MFFSSPLERNNAFLFRKKNMGYNERKPIVPPHKTTKFKRKDYAITLREKTPFKSGPNL